MVSKKIPKNPDTDEEIASRFPLADESPSPTMRVTAKGEILYANPASRSIYTLIDPVTGRIDPGVVECIRKCVKEQKSLKKDFTAESTIYELLISPSKTIGYANIFGHDVTEIRQAQEKIAGLAKFPTENPNPVIRSSEIGHILFANDAAFKLRGAIIKDSPSRLNPKLTQVARSAGRQKTVISANLESDGKIYEMTFRPVPGENYLNIYGREITAEIAAQKALVESNNQLEKRVAERTASVRLLQNIVLAANNADSLAAALQTALHEVCIYTGWPVGHAYVIESRDGIDNLKPTGVWHIDTATNAAHLAAAAKELRFGSMTGLPGRVLTRGQAVWIEYLSRDKKSTRKEFAKEAGLVSGMAFPVISGTQVIGVLEFFSDKRAVTNVDIIETMGHIGTQLGSVAKRKEAEAAIAKSQIEASTAHNRLSNSLEVISQAFALFDKDDRIILFNKRFGQFSEEYGSEPPQIGDTFEEIVRSSTVAGKGTPEENEVRIASALKNRRENRIGQSVDQTVTGRWLRTEGFDTEEGGTVSIFTDVTKAKEHEEELARLAEESRLAHVRLRDALEAMDQGFVLYDKDDRIVMLNKPFVELSTGENQPPPKIGDTFEDMVRSMFISKKLPVHVKDFEKWLKEVLRDRKETKQRDSTLLHQNGKWIRAQGFITSEGGTVSIFTDVTEAKEREVELDRLAKDADLAHARLSDAIEAIGQGFVLFDAQDNFVLFNKKYHDMMGLLSHKPIVGEPFSSIIENTKNADFGNETRDEWIQRILKQRKEEEVRSSTNRLPDGRWYQSEGFKTEEGGIVSVFTDVTELKQHEEELDELVAELGVARDEAVNANSAKSQFLANMSHELRTPLNAIIGYSELLADETLDDGNEEYIPDLEKIQSAGKHLLGLINDILDLSKIEVGKIELFIEDIVVKDLLTDVANTIKPLVEVNNNELVLDIDEAIDHIQSDVTKLRQNLFNLLSNAAKFSKDSTLTMRARLDTSGPEELVAFEVEDRGIGMTQEQLDKIFDPFTQADSSTSKRFGGTGLGLTITREFSRLLGGEITVTSEKNVGTIFRMTVLKNAHKIEQPAAPELSGKTPKVDEDAPLILIIDDDSNVRDLLHRNLAAAGYRTEVAINGTQGLEKAKKLLPAAITLDVIMPKPDGWTVLSELKSDPATAEIPVIMVTIAEDRKLGFSLGALGYLSKPVDRTELIDLLKKFLGAADGDCVLLVEDDEDTRSLVRRYLKKEKIRLVEAENGRVGIEKLRTTKPSIILLDLMMPEMNGFEFIEEYRKNPEWHHIPVIVVTAKILTDSDKSQLEGWVDGFYSKLDNSIEQVLEDLSALLPSG